MLCITISTRGIALDAINVDILKTADSGGNHLVYPAIHKHCRSLCHPRLFTRDDSQSWRNSSQQSFSEVAGETLPKSMAESTKPTIDEGPVQAFVELVIRRKKLFIDSTPNSGLRN